MKKILLSLMMAASFALVKAQTVLNELYTDPGSGKHEFFELYNSSSTGAENLDCYTLLTYFEEVSSTSAIKGFYVIDLPALSVASKAWFVGAAANPFNYQTSSGASANFNWNTGFIPAGGRFMKWSQGTAVPVGTDGNANYDSLSTVGITFNDIFQKDGTNSAYHVLLYKNGVLINAFIGAQGGGAMNLANSVADLTAMPSLFVDMIGCTDFTISFATSLTVNNFENHFPADGTDNGYTRLFDGKCGAWTKASNPGVTGEHTPGAANGSAAGQAGDLTTAQFITCGSVSAPQSFVSFDITAISGDVTEAADFPVEVQIYNDANFNGQLDGTDIFIRSKFQATVAAPSDTVRYDPADADIIVIYKTKRGCFDKVVSIGSACAALPVNFKSFTAARNRSDVILEWETASEENNRGFEIQRRIGSGGWTNVGFVASRAMNGNSGSVLAYGFTDVNSTKGITQYRIRQIDIDGKSAFSNIRAVRGEEQKGKTIIYPNPSNDGKVNVVFEEVNTVRDISLMDMNGRTIKQWKGVTNNTIQIENLTSGVYTVHIVNTETGEQVVEKVVVNKR